MKKRRKKMKLSEIARKVGVPVVNLNSQAIEEAMEKGAITSGQAHELQAELIWQSGAPGVKVADHLW